MTTKTIRIDGDLKDELLKLKEDYASDGTDKADAVTSSDNAWFGYLLKLGKKVFLSNRKER